MFNLIVISDCVTRRLLIEEYESECKLKEIADSITRLHPRNISNGILSKTRNAEPTRDSDVTNQKQVLYFATHLFDHTSCFYNKIILLMKYEKTKCS